MNIITSQKPNTYKRIAIITLVFGLLTNYYVIAITLDTINILLASQKALHEGQTSAIPIDTPFTPLLPLAPVSFVLLLIGLFSYIQYRRTSKA